MKIYCGQCDANHSLTQGQAEVLIYALSGEIADALCEPDGDRIYAGDDPFRHIPCLLAVLDMAASPERHAEHVEACLNARSTIERRGVS